VLSYTPQRVLVLAPHTDDGEIGAGGLIQMMTANGAMVQYVAFSTCEESVPAGYAPDVLRGECLAATSRLGLEPEAVRFYKYRVRRFPEFRQEILENMVALRTDYNPDLVLTPSSSDVHQDHSTIQQEAFRAFKDRSVLGYELPWNCIDFRTDALIALTDDAVAAKVEAIKCYESQSFRGYGDGQPLLRLAELRGSQVGVKYAEAFEVLRWVWR